MVVAAADAAGATAEAPAVAAATATVATAPTLTPDRAATAVQRPWAAAVAVRHAVDHVSAATLASECAGRVKVERLPAGLHGF